MGQIPVQFIIRQITPIDNAVCAVRDDLQVGFSGPIELNTGAYFYREAKSSTMSLAGLYANTDVTQTQVVAGPMNSIISKNFQTTNFCEFIDFYNRAYSFAETYFANISFNNSLVLGYTGSQTFTGSGITGSYIITTSTVGNGYGYNPDDWHYWDNNLEVEENIHYEDFYDVNQDAFWAD